MTWPLVDIGSVCEGIYDGPHATPKKIDRGPIFLSISSLSGGRIDLSQSEHLSELDFKRWTRRVAPREDDVVFSYETRLGEAGIIPRGLRCCLGRRMALMRPDPNKVDPRFLLYAYLGPEFQETIRQRTVHGSTVDRIPLIEFPRFPIRIPPLPEQRAIASILGALDDKIELNRRMNETLEAMARALFKSWFVDFDPVRAKMEGREPAGMDAETAALFPNSLHNSPLGQIPSGWNVVELGQVAEVIDCLHSKKPERQPHGRPLLQLWNIRDDGLMDMDNTYWISESDYSSWTSRIEALPGDCVITNVGRVGASAQIPAGLRAALGRNMTAVRCHPDYPFPSFLIQYLLSSSMAEEIAQKTDTGTILDALNVRSIPKLRLVLAPPELLQRFEEVCRPLRARMEHNLVENSPLGSARDTLLPKLLSGEIQVRDTEGLVEAAS